MTQMPAGEAARDAGVSPMPMATCGSSEPSLERGVSQRTGSREIVSHCSANCHGRCLLRIFMRDGAIERIETDEGGSGEFSDHRARACALGLSLKRVIEHPDRLKYPLKRVGPRGSGQFERCSWDEAIDIICSTYQRILRDYGPEAVMIAPYNGVKARNIPGFLERFLNLNGGFVALDGGYSHAQYSAAMPYLYGTDAKNNVTPDIAHADLVVVFGDNYMETRMGGASDGCAFDRALKARDVRVVAIDPRRTLSARMHADEWIPIRPGTDAALAEAIAYVLITEGHVDQAFLDEYCVGYDAATLPASAPPHSDYKSHILGDAPDATPRTPAWASAITGVPEQVIWDLAREIGRTEKTFITQGLGVQRHMNGEQAVRAICMLAILKGGPGKSGMGTGAMPGCFEVGGGIGVPTGVNPTGIVLPSFLYQQAIANPMGVTARNSWLRGAQCLRTPIKALFNYAGNCLTNQHGDINRSHAILSDEHACELIVTWEIALTDSARYSDIVLPDLLPAEQPSIAVGEWCGDVGYVIYGAEGLPARYERKTLYQSLSLMARKMGCHDEFTEGLDEAGWLEHIYEQARAEDPLLPNLEDMKAAGIYRRRQDAGDGIAYRAFRHDPLAHPLQTPSGKIEVYSERLAKIAGEWELREGDIISPLPIYAPEAEHGAFDQGCGPYPLQLIGFHEKGHVNSAFVGLEGAGCTIRKQIWINPADAAERGICDGDLVEVRNGFGCMRIRAHVTEDIMRGVVAMAQGFWFQEGDDGIEVGGCMNVLTNVHPSPLAKATPAHTNRVQVSKAR